MTYGRTDEGWTDRRDSRNSYVDEAKHVYDFFYPDFTLVSLINEGYGINVGG